MTNPKDVLVVTTSSLDGLKVKQYLRPVSAHIVAGAGFVSDFFASFSDVFGGRSGAYQKQLSSLYNEAIERVKYTAYEIGANCIMGLKVDMDEISGKGKSMFMLTAVGTAVIVDKGTGGASALLNSDDNLTNVGIDTINTLKSKKEIIEKAKSGSMYMNDDTWNFITINQIDEVFPVVLTKLDKLIKDIEGSLANPESLTKFRTLLDKYIDALPEQKQLDLLYGGVKEQDERTALELSKIIKEMFLFDFSKTMELLKSDDFQIQKRAILLSTYDKLFYNKQDIEDLQSIRSYIGNNFKERGKRTTKKQLLSSEKEVWVCECGKTNDIGSHCSGCSKDIYGFKYSDVSPSEADKILKQKIELISECVG